MKLSKLWFILNVFFPQDVKVKTMVVLSIERKV